MTHQQNLEELRQWKQQAAVRMSAVYDVVPATSSSDDQPKLSMDMLHQFNVESSGAKDQKESSSSSESGELSEE